MALARSSSARRKAPVEPVTLRPVPAHPLDRHDIGDSVLRHRISSQGTILTITWVLLVCFALGGALVLMQQHLQIARLNAMSAWIPVHDLQLQTQEMRLSQLEGGTGMNPGSVPAPATTNSVPSVPPSSGAPSAAASSSVDVSAITAAMERAISATSASGKLFRGATSPDGTKFAGYDETAGKKGIGVEVLSETNGRVRRVVVFSGSESSGAGTAGESAMSVRWTAADTIEYDVRVGSGANAKTETRTVKIFF